ncbi:MULTISPECIES: Hha/YmoA family nucleoid-associated regulatory protein [Pantoea]|jgi:hemolysin expression modulating protein|uniref:Hha/YmoA family nucleoid-associated regulatory protein n=1 Tax=Pantoea TaxID=53335 RepID=UPI001F1A4D3E|nr:MULTISPECIES: Hha/YmoA family nucleoid-associated regulatory protein [Pantoea]UIL54912.1 hemolysin [Pantoea agglomerans]
MNKIDYLMQLRNCPCKDILDIVTSYMRNRVPHEDLSSFEGAYDHRKAELVMNETYSEVPSEAWRYVN